MRLVTGWILILTTWIIVLAVDHDPLITVLVLVLAGAAYFVVWILPRIGKHRG
jgi:hypothetical protein